MKGKGGGNIMPEILDEKIGKGFYGVYKPSRFTICRAAHYF